MNGKKAKLLRRAFGTERSALPEGYENIGDAIGVRTHDIGYWADDFGGYHERLLAYGYLGAIRPRDGKRAPIVRKAGALYRRAKRVLTSPLYAQLAPAGGPSQYVQLIRPSQARALDEG